MATKKKSYTNSSENTYILMTVLSLVTICIILLISYFLQKETKVPQVQYFEVKNMLVESKDYNVVTSFSMETNSSGTEWLKKNEKSVLPILQNIIFKTDMDKMTNPEKLTYLQEAFRKETKKNFPKAHIEEILITDFVIQDN